MRRTMAVLLLVAAMLSIGAGARSASAGGEKRASREQIMKLLEVTRCREAVKSGVLAMRGQMVEPFRQMLRRDLPDAGAAELAEMEQVIGRLMDRSLEKFPVDQVVDAMVPAYQEELSASEAEAMIAFYSSSVGREISRKMVSISARAMRDSQPYSVGYLVAAQQAAQATLGEELRTIRKKYHPDERAVSGAGK